MTTLVHSTWDIVTTHAAKYDRCERKGADFCLRCEDCSLQICSRCAPNGAKSEGHHIPQGTLDSRMRTTSRSDNRTSNWTSINEKRKGRTQALKKISRRRTESTKCTSQPGRTNSVSPSFSISGSTSPTPYGQNMFQSTAVNGLYISSMNTSSTDERPCETSLSTLKPDKSTSSSGITNFTKDNSSMSMANQPKNNAPINKLKLNTSLFAVRSSEELLSSLKSGGVRHSDPGPAIESTSRVYSTNSISSPLDVLAYAAATASGLFERSDAHPAARGCLGLGPVSPFTGESSQVISISPGMVRIKGQSRVPCYNINLS